MTDKPKRKRTSNRRRLLWVLVPMVALILGLLALSPQINLWLATDPFTPQCHFEEDRLFATGYSPVYISSINAGQQEPIDHTVGMPIGWSPDGGHLTYIDMTSENFEYILADFKGDEILRIHGLREFAWSSDGRYFAYSVSKEPFEIQVINIYDTHTNSSIGEVDVAGGRFYMEWSPDYQTLLLDDFHSDLWYYVDVFEMTVNPLPGMLSHSIPAWADTRLLQSHEKNN